ncbi:MAG TPA: thioester reductase domain-containing protein [Chloroflexota bacterium]|jgi:thioester reductase-like protein|nr:thioester reductase domain-containing protein [Chloroflexota bacterium]
MPNGVALKTITEQLDHWASREPGRRLYTFLDGLGAEIDSCDYAGFSERTRYLAEHLVTESGVRRGDRVLLVYPPGLEAINAFFACARLGAIPVPVHPPSRRDYKTGLAKMVVVARDCGANTVLTHHSVQRDWHSENGSTGEHNANGVTESVGEPNGLTWIPTDGLHGRASDQFRDNPGEILFLQYTSGSTSAPRGVMVSHENVIHNGRATLDHVPTGGTGVSWLPQYHDMGLIGYYLYPVIAGGATYGFSPMDFLRRPALWLQTIARVRATYASSPNFGFEYCLREDKVSEEELTDVDLSSLESLMNAAEPVRAETYERFFQRFGPYGLRRRAHVVAYGLAENTLAVSHHGRRSVAVDRRLLSEGVLRIETTGHENGNHLRVASCGKPLDGIDVRIVDPASSAELAPGEIGEIWVAGSSTCDGYWDRPALTREIFKNRIANRPRDGRVYLRTGDLGFTDRGELFVCGRIKDLIIVRGVNYHPQDVERVVESASPLIRNAGVAAFNDSEEQESIVVVVEVQNPRELPDPADIAQALRTHHFAGPYTIVLARSKTIARTTSGKLARTFTREQWLNGSLEDLVTYRSWGHGAVEDRSSSLRERFTYLLEAYELGGREDQTLEDIGIDSLDLVVVVDEIEHLLVERGAGDLIGEVDGRLLQRLTVAQLFSVLDRMEGETDIHDSNLRDVLKHLKDEHDRYERESMRFDAKLGHMEGARTETPARPLERVLLTGPTGFFGPFLLASLLQNTPYEYHALTRAEDSAGGMDRIREALDHSRLWWPGLEEDLDQRVKVICGDVSKRNLGLSAGDWQGLTTSVEAVIHNAALVNYSQNYSALKPHNVDGTRELLRLSLTGPQKPFHFISSTIIFGWSLKGQLLETDNNEEMLNLDFGYAQSKWVAEQLVFEAGERGLPIAVYRPSFVSASTGGIASKADITVRLLAFMINHGIGVNARNQISFLPADVAAHNVAAIIGRGEPIAKGKAPTFHVTVDDFYSIIDITRVITSEHGYPFVYFDIPEFVSELKRRCHQDDPLFPLLDFVTRSYLKIARMERKRYDNRRYREARHESGGLADPTLSQTVACLMQYLNEAGLIRHGAVTTAARPQLAPAV